jgi:hypothetical protein
MAYMAFEVPFVAFDLEETKAVAEGAALCLRQGDSLALPGRLTSCWKIPPAAPRWRVPAADAWRKASPGIGRRKPVFGLCAPARSGAVDGTGGGPGAREELPLPDPDGPPYPARACRSWPSIN